MCCCLTVCHKSIKDIHRPQRGMLGLINHLNTVHGLVISTENLSFETEEEFAQWHTKIEQETPCRFIKRKNNKKNNETIYYYCSRSGKSVSKAAHLRKRYGRINGPRKIGHTCPASIVAHHTVAGSV